MNSNVLADQNTNEDLLENNHCTSEQLPGTKPPPSIWFSKRFLVTLLLFINSVNKNSLSGKISIAVVEMTSTKRIIQGNRTTIEPPEYDWDSKTVGLIVSSPSIGYLCICIGGILSTRFGGSITYGVSMAITGILAILGPVSLYLDLYLFLANRMLSGLFEGFASASTSEIFSRWAPVQERSTLTSYGTSGLHVGIALTYPLCGYLVKKWGWAAPFYIEGAVSIVWSLFWLILIRNDPSKDKHISRRELEYIQQGTANAPRKHVVSLYKNIFKSPVFWSLCVGKVAYSWVFTILLVCLPFYVKDVTQKPIEEVGLLSSIPNMVSIVMIPITGTFIDYWQNHSRLEITQIHKILMCVGFTGGSLLLIVAVLFSNFTVSMVCFILIKIIGSLNAVITQVIVLYMAPSNSSVIAGLSAFWYRVSTVLARTTIGYMTPHHSVQEWNEFFLLSAMILLSAAMIFTLYGSSKPQPWSSVPIPNDDERNLSIENKDCCEK